MTRDNYLLEITPDEEGVLLQITKDGNPNGN